MDQIHDRKVETTKGKFKPRNIPLVSTSNRDIFCFSFLTYVNGQIFTSKTSPYVRELLSQVWF